MKYKTRPPARALRLTLFLGASALGPWVFVLASALFLGASALFLGAAAAADPASSNSLRGAGSAAPQSCEQLIEENRLRWPADLPDSLEESRRLYLMGQCRARQGKFQEAERYFLKGLGRDLSLAPHWRFMLFQAAMEGGQQERALNLLRGILAGQPAPELVADLRKLLIDRMQRTQGAIADADFYYYSEYFARVEPTPEDYPLLAEFSQLTRRLGDIKLWRKLRVMLWKVPRDLESAKEGARVLDAMGAERPWRSSADFLVRTHNLAEARLHALIVKELQGPAPPGWNARVGRELGSFYFRSLLQRKKYKLAGLRITDPAFVRRFSFRREDVLRISVQVNLRRRRMPLAIKRLMQLEAANPRQEFIPGFYLRVARYYEDRNNRRAMIEWSNKLLSKYPRSFEAAAAYWLPLWNHYLGGRYEKALQWADKAIANTLTFSAETRSRYHYWRARTLAAMGRRDEAQQAWDALEKLWPTSYYGLMARHARGQDPVPPHFTLGGQKLAKHPAPTQIKAVWQLEPFRTAMFLFVVGKEERAAAIMGSMLGKPIADGLLVELGEVFRYFGRFRLQYRIAANYFYSDLKRYPVSKTPVWLHAYPRAFWDHVLEQTSNYRVSPFFVLAVMREESNFHAGANSVAGAKGLMQLMPATARMVARRNRLPYQESALTTPELNITLGTLYLKAILQRNKWNPVLAAASYNAGPNAVKRWLRKFGKLPVDEFVERIPYGETRAYVKRVMSSYLVYRELYHPSPGPGTADQSEFGG